MATTTSAPDPRDLPTWDLAFSYPVPVTRKLSTQLRATILENKDKLRTLVGTSYRDLLGTADRIIAMDAQMRDAEIGLSDVGARCNARAVETVSRNHAAVVQARRERVRGRNGRAAGLALLQCCLGAARGVLAGTVEGGGGVLGAAKLLVLARLLHGGVAKAGGGPTALVEDLRARLGALRRKVLRRVDGGLVAREGMGVGLLEALAAFSLATTSTPEDVLRHFLRVRMEALVELTEAASAEDMHAAIKLLLATLKDVQYAFPRRLADLLARLQDEPLLRDPALRDMAELNLDVYERWIADDIRNFTPWLRHDQLQGAQAVALLEAWATTAKNTLLDGLSSLLDKTQDPQQVTALRKDFLMYALSAERKLTGLDASEFFEELRLRFMNRLNEIAKASAQDLATTVSAFLTTEDTATNERSDEVMSLWDPQHLDTDLSKGAAAFRKLITNSRHGKNARLQSLELSLSQWSARMTSLAATMKSMRDGRWNEDLDLDLDDDEDEDSALTSPQDLLSKDDPDALNELLTTEQQSALEAVFETLSAAATSTKAQDNASPSTNTTPMLLLRTLREVLHHAQTAPTPHSSQTSQSAPSALLTTLHTALAALVLSQSPAPPTLPTTFPSAHTMSVQETTAVLWEGTPPLPVQPSKQCFAFLHRVSKTMQSLGPDLWTPAAVKVLKRLLAERIAAGVDAGSAVALDGEKGVGAKGVGDALENGTSAEGAVAETNADAAASAEAKTEADAETPAAADPHAAAEVVHRPEAERLLATQTMFDLLYLARVLGITVPDPSSETESASSITNGKLEPSADGTDTFLQVLHRVEQLSAGNEGAHAQQKPARVLVAARMRKSAMEYWRRTYLLFGLLSC